MAHSNSYPVGEFVSTIIAAEQVEVVTPGHPEAGSGVTFLQEYNEELVSVLWQSKPGRGLAYYFPTATTINLLSSYYLWGGTIKLFTPGTAVSLTDDDTNYVYLDSSGDLQSVIDGTGWPSAEHIKICEVALVSGVITTVTDRRVAVASGTVSGSGIATGAIQCKRIASAQLKALLDGSENNLFAANEGDIVLKVAFDVGVAAGAACTVDVGLDAAADGSAKDVDGFLVDADANAAGQYLTENNTYDGVYCNYGPRTIAADGNVIIQSSTDQSGSSFDGGAYMLYIPANAA